MYNLYETKKGAVRDVEKICMFTGHRNINARHTNTLAESVDQLLEKLIEEGYTEFRTGGAVGFDTLVALKLLEKKRKYGFIKLHLFLPCRDQDKGWKDNLRSVYHFVLEQADSIRYTSESYFSGCMHKRNREMVKGSELCVAYCGRTTGGTAYTVNYARKNGLRVINIFE